MTEIDVAATLKKKLDVDFRPYRILGACNPPLAHKALQAGSHIGIYLPCNVIVQDAGMALQWTRLWPCPASITHHWNLWQRKCRQNYSASSKTYNHLFYVQQAGK